MPIINIMCPICTEIYTNSDNVYSTSCGHIFHYSCLNAWTRRENNCPQCRHPNPSIYQLHLSFEESEESPEATEEIQLKLTSSDEKIAQLQEQLAEAERDFLNLQEQFNAAESSKSELEEKFSQMNDLENDFMRLQAEYTDSSELLKDMEDRINQLFIEHECKLEDLRTTTLENDKLKSSLEKKQSTISDDILYEKLKVLEHKLKHISAEFEREIKISTQLSMDKMELQSRIDILNSKNKTGAVLKEQNKKKPSVVPNREQLKKTNTIPNKDLKENLSQQDETLNVVLIKQLPLSEITTPLENVVVKLAAEMQVYISENDLIKVKLLPRNNINSTKGQLVVQFKTSEIRNKFISNKHKFKSHPIFKSVCMDDIHNLFAYAQNKLLNNGFSAVCFRNYKIFAREATGNNNKFIQSKTDVDKLAAKKRE